MEMGKNYRKTKITPWASGLLSHPAVASCMLRIFIELWEINSKNLSSLESPEHNPGTSTEHSWKTPFSSHAHVLHMPS
jgi:hypothetical protein